MGFNENNKKTYYFVDEHDLMLVQNASWNPDGDNGKGDCIGRTLYSYLAYEYEPFVLGAIMCFRIKYNKKEGIYLQGYRHPSYYNIEYNNMSRDHVLNALILMKISDNDLFFKTLSKYLKWKISDKFNFTLELWLWMKGIAGNKLAMFLYYLIDIPMILFSIIWNKIIYKIGGFGKELSQDEFVSTPKDQLPGKTGKYGSLVFPIYSIAQKAFMMYASPNSIGKWLLKKICLWGVDEQNFLLKIMFGGKVDEKDVYSYKPMTGWRWSTYLNGLNNRDLQIIKNSDLLRANVLDVDLLKKMYKNFK